MADQDFCIFKKLIKQEKHGKSSSLYKDGSYRKQELDHGWDSPCMIILLPAIITTLYYKLSKKC